MAERPTYSLVVPIYNEEAVLPLLLPRLDTLLARLDGPAEVVFIDDGSSDLSTFILEQRARHDGRFKLVSLSRNFGQQLAITAGLDLACGDAVIIMDADLQDPPEVILDLVAKWHEGFDVVCAQRASRAHEGWFKTISASLFYRCMSRLAHVDIPQNVGDFRLIDRKVVDVVRRLPERERFVRGLFSWVGFRHALVPFHRPERAAGQTKYSIWKLTRLAVEAIISFSEAPLRLVLWSGSVVSVLGIVYGCIAIIHWYIDPNTVPGTSSTVVVAAFLGGANMLMTGIVGLYVGRIYSEVKGRPLYIIDRSVGLTAGVLPTSAVDLHEPDRVSAQGADGLARMAS